jgi:hypothetical protein
MFKKSFILIGFVLFVLIAGCATVPLAPNDQDLALKKFPVPSENNAALYVYRNSFVGQALKKNIYLDGQFVGESANKVYFYREITPGEHQLSTESEFSDNSLVFQAESGQKYFAEQYIKMGVFVGGANLKMVSEEEGMKNVLECNLAK